MADRTTAPSVSSTRREDAALLQGRGSFVGDIVLAGMLHAAFVRSPHSHARVLQVDTSEAARMPGVRAVLTASDFAGLRAPSVNAQLAATQVPDEPLLSGTHVRSVGEPVALVIAQTAAEADAAAALVQVDYEDLPACLPFGDMAWPGPAVAELAFESGPMPTEAPTATVRVEMPRVSPAPLEPRACLVAWEAGAETLTAWLSTQTPSRARDDLARCLSLPQERVRVIAPDVGGAFGGKASVYPEDLLLAAASVRLRQPLRWQATRGEDLLYGTHGRGSRSEASLWIDAAGAVTAIDAAFEFSLGHWLPYSVLAPMRNAQRIVPGPYRVARQRCRSSARRSHTAAVNIYRGAGRPEAAVLLERLIDAAAQATGRDPLDLRLQSVWPSDELPARLPNGETLDRSDLPGLLRDAADTFDYRRRRLEQAQRRERDELVGIGIGLYVEPCGQGWESARITCTGPGRYQVATGSSSQGQGRETAYAAIAAEALGCDPAAIDVVHGDTARCPPGIGALASRSTAIGGSAVLLAARQLRQELAAGAALPHSVEIRHTAEHEAWASGCVMCQVCIDGDTGELRIEHLTWIDDAGHVVDPMLVHGQMMGGLAQGIGQALMEQIVHDAQGQLLTGSFMDYALPRAEDMPRSIRFGSRSTHSAANPLGAKGVGEAGCIGVPAALLNAACDALAHVPALQLDFPLTPDKLWRALRAAPSPTNRTP